MRNRTIKGMKKRSHTLNSDLLDYYIRKKDSVEKDFRDKLMNIIELASNLNKELDLFYIEYNFEKLDYLKSDEYIKKKYGD